MNTQQLESFIQVAENLNFARAAEDLNITQSAISRQIHSLEDELGTKLLHRSTRMVTLTHEGISFLETAKKVIMELQISAVRIQHHEEYNMQIISIGCRNEADLSLLSDVLTVCRQQLPELHPFIKVIPHRSILNLFYQNEIDILLGFKDDIPIRDGIIYKELAKIPICCVLPSFHKFSQKEKIDLEKLFGERVITCYSYAIPSKVTELQNQIASHLLPNSVYICENLYVMISLINAGYGCSILPKMNFAVTDIKYIPLNNVTPLSYGIFYKKSSLNPLHKKFISIVKNIELS